MAGRPASRLRPYISTAICLALILKRGLPHPSPSGANRDLKKGKPSAPEARAVVGPRACRIGQDQLVQRIRDLHGDVPGLLGEQGTLPRETGRTRLRRAGRGGFVGSHIKEGEPPKLPLLKGVLF